MGLSGSWTRHCHLDTQTSGCTSGSSSHSSHPNSWTHWAYRHSGRSSGSLDSLGCSCCSNLVLLELEYFSLIQMLHNIDDHYLVRHGWHRLPGWCHCWQRRGSTDLESGQTWYIAYYFIKAQDQPIIEDTIKKEEMEDNNDNDDYE